MRLKFATVSFLIGFLFVSTASASNDSGILNTDGINQNGEILCDEPAIQFKLSDSLDEGDSIEIEFPNEFGALNSPGGVNVKKDTDLRPNNGIDVATTTNIVSNTLTITLDAGSEIENSSTVYIDSFTLGTPCPANIYSAKITTFDNDNNANVLDYGIAKHSGNVAFNTHNFINPVLSIALAGTNVDFGTLLFDVINTVSITQATITTNSPDWTLYASYDHEPQNVNLAIIEDWNDPNGPGFGMTARTLSPDITIIAPYAGTGALSTSDNPVLTGTPVDAVIVNIDFSILIDVLQQAGDYSNIVTLTVSPDF